jgi:hypothetical protein
VFSLFWRNKKNDMILCTSVCILPSFLEHPYRHFDRASKLRIRFHHSDQERLHLQKTCFFKPVCDTRFGERFKLRSGDSTQINVIWYRRFSSANRDAYFQLKIRVKYGQSAVQVNGLKASHGWCGSSVTLTFLLDLKTKLSLAVFTWLIVSTPL